MMYSSKMADEEKQKKSEKEKQEEENAKAALDLAGKIFEVMKDKRMRDVDAQTRHRMLIQKYPNFAQAYPLVLRFMAIELKYQPKAFQWLLNKLKRDPGKGMEGYIECQAAYARQLQIEEWKATGKRVNMTIANKIYELEYSHMRKVAKKMEEDEKKARNEFEDESKRNLDQKKAELLQFLNETQAPEPIERDPELEQYERAALGLHPKSIGDINVDDVSGEELTSLFKNFVESYRELCADHDNTVNKAQECKVDKLPAKLLPLTEEFSGGSDEEMRKQIRQIRIRMDEIDEKIKSLRNRIEEAEENARQAELSKERNTLDPAWLEGTCLDPKPVPKKPKQVQVKARGNTQEKGKRIQQKKEEDAALDALVANIEGSKSRRKK